MLTRQDHAMRDFLLRGLRAAGLSLEELRRLNRVGVAPVGNALEVTITWGPRPRVLHVQAAELVVAHHAWVKGRFWDRQPAYFVSREDRRLSARELRHLVSGTKKPADSHGASRPVVLAAPEFPAAGLVPVLEQVAA